MKLKVKNLKWLAGRPVVILDRKTAEKLSINVDERIALYYDSKKIYAVVDIFEKFVKSDEIGISHEVSRILKVPDKFRLEIGGPEFDNGGNLIKKKISGKHLSKEEINTLVSEITNNVLTEAEISYFVAAEKMRGLSHKELIYLTESMVNNGTKLNFNEKIVADKHCIGGIPGNRTTPIVVSICAVAGLTLPKNSSRAITSASGTADVMETLAKVDLSIEEIKKVVKKQGACLVWGGSLGLAPSDDKIIQVERLLNLDVEPQLLASIMSKKIAAGSNHVLIDIPYGKTAKVKSKKQAINLGNKFKELAKHFKIKVKSVYTDGSQAIGNGVGPVLEMLDILAVLKNENNQPQDLRKKSLYLAEELMSLCNIKNAKQKAEEILLSGKAYEKFKQIVNEQNKQSNNPSDFDKKVKSLKLAKFKKIIRAQSSGKITELDNNKINSICRILGTPETKSAGLYLHKHANPKENSKVSKGEPIMTLYSESPARIKDAIKFIKEFRPIQIK